MLSSSSNTIWYHSAPQYWIRAMNFIPEFRGREAKISSHVKTLIASNLKKRDQIICVLNSSLFYGYFVITSNDRNLTSKTIHSINIDLENLSNSHAKLLTEYCSELMDDLQPHSKIKNTEYEKTGTVVYQEFFPEYSKSILDKIVAF